MTLTVCGLIGSPFYRKVCTQLAEKNIAYETETLSPFTAGDDFTAINPIRRIPVLKDSDVSETFTLSDSSAIAQYIERKYPQNPLMPSDPSAYGKALWFEEYADTEMAGKIGLGVFRPVVFPQLAGKEPDLEAAAITVREKLPAVHDYIESELEGKEWLAGDMFSIADISVAVQYANLSIAGYVPSASRWPNIVAFMKRIGGKDSFAKLHIKAVTVFASQEKLEINPSEGL